MSTGLFGKLSDYEKSQLIKERTSVEEYKRQSTLVSDNMVEIISAGRDLDRDLNHKEQAMMALESLVEYSRLEDEDMFIKSKRTDSLRRGLNNSLESYGMSLEGINHASRKDYNKDGTITENGVTRPMTEAEKKEVEEINKRNSSPSSSSKDKGFFGKILDAIMAVINFIWGIIKSIGRFFGKLFGLIKDEEKKTSSKVEEAKKKVDEVKEKNNETNTSGKDNSDQDNGNKVKSFYNYKETEAYKRILARFTRRYGDHTIKHKFSDLVEIARTTASDLQANRIIEFINVCSNGVNGLNSYMGQLVDQNINSIDVKKLASLVNQITPASDTGKQIAFGLWFIKEGSELCVSGDIRDGNLFKEISSSKELKEVYYSKLEEVAKGMKEDSKCMMNLLIPSKNFGGLGYGILMLYSPPENLLTNDSGNSTEQIGSELNELSHVMDNTNIKIIKMEPVYGVVDTYDFFEGYDVNEIDKLSKSMDEINKLFPILTKHKDKFEEIWKKGDQAFQKELKKIDNIHNKAKSVKPHQQILNITYSISKLFRKFVLSFSSIITDYYKGLVKNMLIDISTVSDVLVKLCDETLKK